MTIAVIVVALLFAVAWVLVRGIGAADELKSVSSTTATLQEDIGEGELDSVPALARRIGSHAQSARELTSDPVWRAFEFVPWLGESFTATREVAEVAADVAGDALTPIVSVTENLDLGGLGLAGGSIDLSGFADAEAPLQTAATALARAEDRADRIDAAATLPPLADAVQSLRDTLTQASATVGALHGAAALLPSMLGAEGPRQYVIAVEDNAEARSTGGAIGALLVVRAENNQITLIGQASSRDFAPLGAPLAVSEGVAALYGDAPGTVLANATSIPDFAEAAPVIAQMWLQRWGYPVDGVIAVDTVVVANLLDALDTIEVPPLTLDADSARKTLLVDSYTAVPDPAAHDALMVQVAATLFSEALWADPQPVLASLARSADDGRIRIWSAHEDEQRALAASWLGGTIPNDSGDRSHVGVLFDDATGGKLDAYADAAITVSTGVCRGEPTTRVTVAWTNDAPADAADALPPIVTGGTDPKLAPGQTRTLIAVVGPEDAEAAGHDRDGEDDDVRSTMLAERAVQQFSVLLAPGESTVLTADFRGKGAGVRLTDAWHTPLPSAVEVARTPLTCDR
ncbi:hypothetical protein GCM10025768_10340 [Microbacterium pseudoresistens]